MDQFFTLHKGNGNRKRMRVHIGKRGGAALAILTAFNFIKLHLITHSCDNRYNRLDL